jgi:hypothetical protein
MTLSIEPRMIADQDECFRVTGLSHDSHGSPHENDPNWGLFDCFFSEDCID